MGEHSTLKDVRTWAHRAAAWCLRRDDLAGFEILVQGTTAEPELYIWLTWPYDPETRSAVKLFLVVTAPFSDVESLLDVAGARYDRERSRRRDER